MYGILIKISAKAPKSKTELPSLSSESRLSTDAQLVNLNSSKSPDFVAWLGCCIQLQRIAHKMNDALFSPDEPACSLLGEACDSSKLPHCFQDDCFMATGIRRDLI